MNESWNRVLASPPAVLQSPKYARSIGDRKGVAPKYVLYLWVGWLLQRRIIDGPACQGVLIWGEVCQVGMWVSCACNHLLKSDICASGHFMSAMLKDVD